MALGMTASTAKVRPFVAPVRRGRTSDSGAGGDQVERPFISSAMLAVMMVIASEMMLFSGLIGTFLVYRMSSAFSAAPADRSHLGEHLRAVVERRHDDACAARSASQPPAPDAPLSAGYAR